MKKYIVLHPSKDPSNLKHTNYIVDVDDMQDFCDVWEMQKHWFSSGAMVTIQDLDSLETKTFIKE